MFDSALLVLIDNTGYCRVTAETLDLPAMALRYDQAEATQLLFLNIHTNTIDTVALLHGEQPWIRTREGAYIPHVVEYMPLMEPIDVDPVNLNHAFVLGALPALDIEGITVDPDELETDVNYLGSQIVDEMVLNRRSPNHESVKRSLLSSEISRFNACRAQLEEVLRTA